MIVSETILFVSTNLFPKAFYSYKVKIYYPNFKKIQKLYKDNRNFKIIYYILHVFKIIYIF